MKMFMFRFVFILVTFLLSVLLQYFVEATYDDFTTAITVFIRFLDEIMSEVALVINIKCLAVFGFNTF